jgi:tetratricopeptide (TPR) repeat protein
MQNTAFSLSSIRCYLIADQGCSRSSIRTLLGQCGVKLNQIQTCETLAQATELIKTHRPQVFFIDDDLMRSGGKALMQNLVEGAPEGQSHATFLLTTRSTMTEASSAAGDFVDSVIMRPFTFESLQKEVSRVIESKFFPNPSQRRLQEGVNYLKADQLDRALDIFTEVKTLAPDMALADFYLAEIFFKQGKKHEALLALKQGLNANPTHYRCLLSMVDFLIRENNYADAYLYARKLAEHHPIPVEKLPAFIRLSLLNEKYHDILKLYAMVEQMKDLAQEISSPLTAGLVVCGLHFLKKNDTVTSLRVFKSAEILSHGRPSILIRMITALCGAGLDSEAYEFLQRAPAEVKESMPVKLALLKSERQKSPLAALKTALGLIASHEVDRSLFEITIELSIELKRRRMTVENLIDAASHSFPEARWDHFKKAIEALP